jgi:predicted N-acetyltransferase YhbS
MDYQIRLIKENEIEEAAKVYGTAFNNAGVGEKWTNETAFDFLNFWYKKAKDLFFVAVKDGNIIGGVVGEIIPYAEGRYFSNGELFVDPSFQNNGIGKELTRKVISFSIDKFGIKYLCWIANAKAEFPISWYKKIGMQETRWVLMDGKAREVLKNLNK